MVRIHNEFSNRLPGDDGQVVHVYLGTLQEVFFDLATDAHFGLFGNWGGWKMSPAYFDSNLSRSVGEQILFGSHFLDEITLEHGRMIVDRDLQDVGHRCVSWRSRRSNVLCGDWRREAGNADERAQCSESLPEAIRERYGIPPVRRL